MVFKIMLWTLLMAICLLASAPFVPYPPALLWAFGIGGAIVIWEVIFCPYAPISWLYWLAEIPHRRKMKRLDDAFHKYGVVMHVGADGMPTSPYRINWPNGTADSNSSTTPRTP